MTCAYCRQDAPMNKLCDTPQCQEIRHKTRSTHTLAGAFYDMEAGAHADKYFSFKSKFRIRGIGIPDLQQQAAPSSSEIPRDVDKEMADFRRALKA